TVRDQPTCVDGFSANRGFLPMSGAVHVIRFICEVGMSEVRTALVLFTIVFASLTGASSHPVDKNETKLLSFAILQDYDKGEDLRQVAMDFDLMNDLGVHTWRGSFGWDDYEPANGKYDFRWLHQFVDVAAKNGITLRPYIGYTPGWASKGGADSNVW